MALKYCVPLASMCHIRSTYACLLEVLQYLYFRESKVGVIQLLSCGLRGVEGGVQDNCGIGDTGMIVVMGGGGGG